MAPTLGDRRVEGMSPAHAAQWFHADAPHGPTPGQAPPISITTPTIPW